MSSAGLELGEIPLELGTAVLLDGRQRRLERGDPGAVLAVGDIGLSFGLERLEHVPGSRQAFLGGEDSGPRRFTPVADALARGAGGKAAPGQLLPLGAPLRQCGLGRLAAFGHARQLPLELGQPAAGTRRFGLRLRHRVPLGAGVVACQLPSGFERLALEPGVELGGLGLALQRPQPGARLALDVERPIEVVHRPGELELGAATTLAVLPQSRRLLDQEPAITRFRGHDRFDAALGDDRVHLLAETGIRKQLDDIDEPAPGAGDPVLAVARAIEPAKDRNLGSFDLKRAVAVVEHDLDLGALGRLAPRCAAEDHILHRLPPHRRRRLLSHRPQHRVGHVRLARAVRPDDDAHAGTEIQTRAIGEGLEALESDRLQVHGRTRFCLTARSPGARPGRQPARHPSCSAPIRGRPPRRRRGR